MHTDKPGTRQSPAALLVQEKNLFRRKAPPTRWIAAVSAAKVTSRKVRKVREVLKLCVLCVLCGLKFFGGLTSAIQKGFWLRRRGLAGRSVSPPVD